MEFNPNVNLLLSYHYFQNFDLDVEIPKLFRPPYPSIFLDSGAWSAFTKKVPLHLHEYAAYIKRFRHWFKAYASLDDLTSAEKTLNNQHRLEDLGLNPLPVYHAGESLDVFSRYVEEYSYVCVGRIVPYTNRPKKIIPLLIQCHKLANGKAAVHGFGVTNWQLLKMFPWYSVDSSSWLASNRYGQVPVFDDNRGVWSKIIVGNLNSVRCHVRAIGDAGLKFYNFSDRERYSHILAARFSAIQYLKVQRFLRKRHGEIHIPGNQDSPGLNLHLVTDYYDMTQRLGITETAATERWKGETGMHVPKLHLHLVDNSLLNLHHGVSEESAAYA